MYGVRFIDDDALPEGHDYAMIRTAEDTVFFFKRSKLTPRVLEQAWAAYRALPGVDAVSLDERLECPQRLAPTG